MTVSPQTRSSPSGEVGSPPTSARIDRGARSTAWRLAAFEGRRTLRHPATLVGLVLSSALVWLLSRDISPVLHRDTATVAVVAAALAGGVLLAANLTADRPRRHDIEELYRSYASTLAQRTAANLLAALWPAGLGLLWALTAVGYLYALGGIWSPEPFDVLAVPASVAFAAVLGVALARWMPSGMTAPIALVALVAVQSWLTGGMEQRLVLLADWAPTSSAPELWPRDPGLHIFFVVAATLLIVAVAMLRHGRTWRRLAAAIVTLGLVIASAAMLLRPWTEDEVDRITSLIAQPERLHACVEHSGVSYCAPPAYKAWVPRWRSPVESALRLLPDSSQPESLRISLDVEPWAAMFALPIPDADRQRLYNQGQPSSDPGTLQVPIRQGRGRRADAQELALAVHVVREALGFGGEQPLEGSQLRAAVEGEKGPGYDVEESGIPPDVAVTMPCTPAGQAREVVTFYLAARATPAAERGLRDALRRHPRGLRVLQDGGAVFNDQLELQDTWDPRTSTMWSTGGATLALRLLDATDEHTTLAKLHAEWDRWSEPTATANDLAISFGIAALPTLDQPARAAGVTPAREFSPGGVGCDSDAAAAWKRGSRHDQF